MKLKPDGWDKALGSAYGIVIGTAAFGGPISFLKMLFNSATIIASPEDAVTLAAGIFLGIQSGRASTYGSAYLRNERKEAVKPPELV